MNFVNPNFKLNVDNVFNLRLREFSKLEEKLTRMLSFIDGWCIENLSISDDDIIDESEIYKTLKRNINISLVKNDKSQKVDLLFMIPKLIMNNYFLVGGRYKIGEFQLFDVPISSWKDSIRLRFNTCQGLVYLKKKKSRPSVYISIFNRDVPLVFLLLSLKSYNELISELEKENNNNIIYTELLKDLSIHDEKHTREYYLKQIPRGDELVASLNIIPKIDPCAIDFLETGSIIDDLIKYIRFFDPNSYLSYDNKRVRFLEYIITGPISKILFDFYLSSMKRSKRSFSANSNEIMKRVNVSEIIQFDFSINPIEELSKLSTISLSGRDGFNKQNVPESIRDIDKSQFGRICPVDTPDRENCGVVMRLLPNVILDDNLRFSKIVDDRQVVSVTTSFVPFLEHDDPTRLQMAASQMRQAILLSDLEKPLIQSGCESLYTDKTQFIKKAKLPGDVIFADSEFIIIKYDNNEIDIFDVRPRKIYIDNLDIFNVYVKTGDRVSEGQIVAESYFCDNGSICIGKNLKVGVCVYHGLNYEDGIVISDRMVKESVLEGVGYKDLSFFIPSDSILLSLDKDTYKPLPNIGDVIQSGQPYAIIKKIPPISSPLSIFDEENLLTCDKTVVIRDIKVYVNNCTVEGLQEWMWWIKKKVDEQKERENIIISELQKHLPDDKLEEFKVMYLNAFYKDNFDFTKYENTFKRKIKEEVFDGIYVEMTGLYLRPIEVGDKLGNRHGNKGVVSAIIPQEKMLKLSDGSPLDIIINPLGIISRMNIGQLFELHLSMSLQDLKKKMLQLIENGSTNDELKGYLLKYIEIVSRRARWYYEQFKEQLKNITIDKEFIENLTLIQPPFESLSIDDLKEAMEYSGTSFVYEVYDPVTGSKLQNPIAVGYMYFIRMIHIAEDKITARSIGSYNKKTLQPSSGKKHKGGQRLGEMECCCMIATEGVANLSECLTLKSDSVGAKSNWIKKMLSNENNDTIETDDVNESVRLLNAYLTALGVMKGEEDA